jgi:Na+-transporting NADH:ubiquinone oxidoreductase subunit A
MHLKRQGGYNVPLAGRPASATETLPEPDALFLPLRSGRLTFTEPAVADGQSVRAGEVLARDRVRFDVPLLAPRDGTVRLEAVEDHIVLEDPAPRAEEAFEAGASRPDPRQRLLDLGAWGFVEDARTGVVPDPAADPTAVIVSTVRLEPFGARGEAMLRSGLEAFSRGLERLQGLLAYQPIYLVMPDVDSALAEEVHDHLRGHAFLQIVTIPLTYPMDDWRLIARGLDLASGGAPVWALRAEGVLAVDRALTHSRPTLDVLTTVGGPEAKRPRHLRVPPGYPLDAIRSAEVEAGARLILGGAMTGAMAGDGVRGVPLGCPGLTALAPMPGPQLFGWIRPGASRQSYSRTFLSRLRRAFPERMPTALRGERRACIACGLCEEVCPAGIMPHMIHKYLYQDSLDDAERLGVDLCIGCGLCSYVCPSKIELRAQFLEAQQDLAEERREAAEAAAAAAAKADAQEGAAS